MTGVSTVRDIYKDLESRPGEPTLVNLLRRDIYGHPFSDVLSASGLAQSRVGRCRPQELGAGQRCAAIHSPRLQSKVPNHLLVNEPSLSTQGIGGSCGR